MALTELIKEMEQQILDCGRQQTEEEVAGHAGGEEDAGGEVKGVS